ncbi:MAG: tRNA lysidine(34) synthetase TilS [Proteobacteria bacterium]|nr:tRNA lysidine(34) synthetase TilS [Pseudomonadota bacterium]
MNKKKPFAELSARVSHALTRFISPNSRILLAVSGGSDSLGLMHLAAANAKRHELHIGFVNHGLRKGVDKEFDLVNDQARKLGIEVHYSEVPPDEVSRASSFGSIQAWAREARYDILNEMAKRLEIGYIATGHTRDDQAETVLLRLIRGTGLDGLGGILDRRDLSDGIAVVRPLLTVTRLEIRDYLQSLGLVWVDDPSNEDNRFLRVRVRRELLPLIETMQPGASERIAAISSESGAVADFLENETFKDDRVIKNLRLSAGVRVEHSVFSGLPEGLWGRIIRSALKRVRGDLRRIERTHLKPIEELIRAKKSTGILPLPGETVVHVDRGSLYAFPRALPPKPSGSGELSQISSGLWQIRFEALGILAEIRAEDPKHAIDLEVRARCPGDRLLGSKKRFKDVLMKARVPRPYKDFVPVLAKGCEIVSSPILVENRHEDLDVKWVIDSTSPILDIDFWNRSLNCLK